MLTAVSMSAPLSRSSRHLVTNSSKKPMATSRPIRPLRNCTTELTSMIMVGPKDEQEGRRNGDQSHQQRHHAKKRTQTNASTRSAPRRRSEVFRIRPAPPVLLPAFANWLMPVTPLCHPAGRLQSAGWVIPVVRLGPPGGREDCGGGRTVIGGGRTAAAGGCAVEQAEAAGTGRPCSEELRHLSGAPGDSVVMPVGRMAVAMVTSVPPPLP